MKKSQLVTLAVAIVAVALIAVLSSSGKDEGSATSAPAQAPAGSVRVLFAYSPEKEKLLTPLIDRFNATEPEVDGKRIFVAGQNISSGDAESKIARGTFKPVAWSPASSLWGRLLNFESDAPYAAATNPSIVRTPLVLAMWEPMARALGYPKRKLGFADILKLARSNKGWRDYGLAQYGKFKLVHTNPDFSTSGLSAVVAEYYAATGKREGLRSADLVRARSQVKAIERSIVHYGDTTLFMADQLRRRGPGYASAVAMEEVTLVDFNQRRGKREKLVAIYPSEGTFYSDNPFITLDAPWVSAQQRKGAESFQKYLSQNVDAAAAARNGFRSADLDVRPVAPLDASNGVDASQPRRVLELPQPRVLAAVKKAWREDRKPANVLLVLDTSGSMADEQRLENAKSGLRGFLREVAPQDRVGLLTFNDEVLPLAPVGSSRGRLNGLISSLIADGETAIYDATDAAVKQVKQHADESRINAVVLLTDGADSSSSKSIDAVVRALDAQGESNARVRVFTIAYSAGAAGATANLRRIADASGGKAYTGTTDDIETVYRSISSFF